MFKVDIHEVKSLENGLKRTKKESRKREIEEYLGWIQKKSTDISDIGCDYIIIGTERAYFIERKTLTDLVGSIFSPKSKSGGRFWEQLERIKEMASNYEEESGTPSFPLIIIEGNIFSRYNGQYARLTRPQWFGIQARINELGVGIIRTWSLNETRIALDTLLKRSGKPVRQVRGLMIKKSLRDEREEAIHMLYAVSGVGEKKAVELLNRFGSVRDVVNMDKETLMKVLGRKVGEHFYNVVNKRFVKKLF